MADYLRALRYFCETVQAGGITAAANRLDVSKSLISKQIKWLEAEFKSQLLETTTRRIRLTHVGQKLFVQSKQMLANWSQMRHEIQNEQETLSGHIQVGSTSWYGSHILNHHLMNYLHKNENISIGLDLISRPIDLMGDQLDMCVTTDQYIVDHVDIQKIKLGSYRVQLVASKKYLAKFGEPKNLEALNSHIMIVNPKDSGRYNGAVSAEGEVRAKSRLSVNSIDCIMQAVVSGLGIAYAFDIDPVLENPDVVPVLTEHVSSVKTLYLAYLNKSYISYLLEDCIDYLVENLSRK